MRFLIDCAKKDLLRRLTDPLSVALWLGIPLTIGGLMGLAMSPSGAGPTIHVLLVDEDDTFISNFVSGARGQGDLGNMLKLEDVEREEGLERIEDGDASALVILPAGFTEALLKDEPATITLITNPAQTIAPAMIEEGLEMLVEAGFYAQRVLGAPLRELIDGPPDGAEFFQDIVIASASGEINRRMRRLEGTLFPPVLKLELGALPSHLESVADQEEEAKDFNFGIFFIPGVLFMALLFISQGMIEDLWTEKEQGTLRRIVSTPQSLVVFLGGKLLAGAILMAGATLIGMTVNVLAYDIPLRVVPGAILWCAFTGTALLALFFLLQFFASNRRGASVLTSAVLFPLMMIGGSFFPFAAMPPWMVSIGKWTPNGMGVLVLTDIIQEDLTLPALALPTLVLGGLATLALLLSERLLRKRFVLS